MPGGPFTGCLTLIQGSQSCGFCPIDTEAIPALREWPEKSARRVLMIQQLLRRRFGAGFDI
jgi:hypothetical protein